MAIEGLTLIGESINDSVPSTRKLYEAGDTDALRELARFQAEQGAHFIDVNVGSRGPELLAEMVRRVQSVTDKPVSIDTPDPAAAAAALRVYDPAKAGGQPPLLNSISPLRMEMFDLLSIQPFRPILLASERDEEGRGEPNHTAEQCYDTAKLLVAAARDRGLGNDDLIIDSAIAPIGSDSEGHLHRVVGAIEKIGADPDLAGVHQSLGLSNFTVMLPSRRADGSPTKAPLESAFLTLTMPLGLDTVIGSVKRQYERLPDDHPAMQCVKDCLDLEGFDVIMRVQEYYA